MVGTVNILRIFFFNMFHCATLQKKFCQDRVLTIHVYEIVIISSCLNSKYKKSEKRRTKSENCYNDTCNKDKNTKM